MVWQRSENAALSSDAGYRIRALRVGVWCYSAFGPEQALSEHDDRLWLRGHAYRLHYAHGQRVPPAYNYKTKTARWHIGCYRADSYGGTAEALAAAKAACEDDHEQQQTTGGQCDD